MLSRLAFALAALSLFSACSVESTAPEPSGPCSDATLAPDEYVAGLMRAGKNGTVGVKLLDALPAPPAAGANEWEAQLVDASNAPLPDATITKVRLWMPSHGHGSGVTPTVTLDHLDSREASRPAASRRRYDRLTHDKPLSDSGDGWTTTT